MYIFSILRALHVYNNNNMMDYLSEYPPPSKQNAVSFVTNSLFHEFTSYGVAKTDIDIIADVEYERLGESFFGSQAGWLFVTSKLFMNNVRNKLNERFSITNKKSETKNELVRTQSY